MLVKIVPSKRLESHLVQLIWMLATDNLRIISEFDAAKSYLGNGTPHAHYTRPMKSYAKSRCTNQLSSSRHTLQCASPKHHDRFLACINYAKMVHLALWHKSSEHIVFQRWQNQGFKPSKAKLRKNIRRESMH